MNLMVILFSLACLVWMVPIIRAGRLLPIALLVLGIGTVFGPTFFAIDGPIQFSLDRLMWFGMFVLAVAGWRLGYTRDPELCRMDWLVIGIVAWFFCSALRGGSVPTGSSPTARWFFYIVMPVGMYAIARLVDVRRIDIRWILGGSILLGVYLAVTAMLEIAGAHSLVFPTFIADAEFWQFYGRGRGPLMNPSGNGILMSISLVATLLAFMYAGRRGKLVYAMITIVLLGGVYSTLTRSAWLGACAAFLLIVLVYSPRWVRVLGLASVVVLGGISIGGVKDKLIRMKRDKHLTAADAKKSVELRPLLAVVAWEMFKDRPLIGHGYGHYFEHHDPYHTNRSYGLPLEQVRSYAQHNVFLSILVDTGLVGLSMFAAWLAMLVGIGWRLARQDPSNLETRCTGFLLLGAMMAYLANGMFQDVSIIPMVHMYLFFLAGVSVTVYQRGLVACDTEHAATRLPNAAAAAG